MTPVSPRISPVLEQWLKMTQSAFEFTDFDETDIATRTRRRYLFAQKRDPNRCMDPTGFTTFVKQAFGKHTPNGETPCPTLLRSAFITLLRESTQDTELLQSAATAQKHSIAMQSSDTYDLDTHIRATSKAMDWCEAFANGAQERPAVALDLQFGPRPRAPEVLVDVETFDLPQDAQQPDPCDEPQPDPFDEPQPDPFDDPQPDPLDESQLDPLDGPRPAPKRSFTAPDDQQWKIDLVTGGTISDDGTIYHKIMWDGCPELVWWQRLPEAAEVLAGADYVGLAIHFCPIGTAPELKTPTQHAVLGQRISSGTHECFTPDGTCAAVNIVRCVLDGGRTDWVLCHPHERFVTDLILNFHSSEALSDVHSAWYAKHGRVFPSIAEAVTVTLALSPETMFTAKDDVARLQVLLSETPVTGWVEIKLRAAAARRSVIEDSIIHDCLMVLSSR
jgi:hypothetical protein